MIKLWTFDRLAESKPYLPDLVMYVPMRLCTCAITISIICHSRYQLTAHLPNWIPKIMVVSWYSLPWHQFVKDQEIPIVEDPCPSSKWIQCRSTGQVHSHTSCIPTASKLLSDCYFAAETQSQRSSSDCNLTQKNI